MNVPERSKDYYVAAFAENDNAHLQRAREIRRRIWAGSKELDVSLGVLAAGGSAELCGVYEDMAVRIERMQGKPLMVVTGYSKDLHTDKRANITAGIISGEVLVRSNFGMDRAPDRGASGYVSLDVPVTSRVSYSSNRVWSQNRIRYPDTAFTTISVAHLVNAEWENWTTDPGKDLSSQIKPEDVMIGMEGITAHESFAFGGRQVLLALNGEVPIEPNE